MKHSAAALVLLALSTLAYAQDKPREARHWQYEKSDIPVDPRIHFGHLDNGMRFAWMKNGEPQKRSYLRLHVDVGSLAEEDNERGLAHFLEHMAFNGSRHFPAGTLIEWFQKHGMSFGADTNASTGFSETIYDIDLPTSDRTALDEGLGVLRDFADGLLLDQKEIDAERGVIDAEERERDSASWRVFVRTLETQFAGTRVVDRIPIGKKSVRDAFTSDGLRKFYAKWYRPEKMTLIVVGDLGDLDPTSLIQARFNDMKSPSDPPPREPSSGVPKPKERAFCIYDKDLSSVRISVERMTPWRERPENLALWKEELPLQCARGMLNLRFSELRKQPGAPFLNASAHDGYETDMRVANGEDLAVSCAPDRWKDALSSCEKELRRALEFGFDASELAEIRADLLRSLDEAVEREKTAPSSGYVELLLDAAENPVLPNGAEAQRRLMKPMIDALDVEACHKAFAEAWKRGELELSMTGNLDLGANASSTLADAYAASAKEPVEARKQEKSAAFAYASDASKAGKVASRKHVDEFDLEEVVFENGVKLHAKKTGFKQREILLSLLIGEGRLSIDPKEQALPWVASRAFLGCGLGQHSADELRRITAGKEVGVTFAIQDDQFQFAGATTREDLVMQCELMRAYVVDPGWREEGLREVEKQVPLIFDALKKQSGGAITEKFLPEFYSHAPRVEFPSRASVEAVTTAVMRDWIGGQFKDAPIDIVIVGDVEIDAAVQAVARTFGALDKRREPLRFEERRKPAVLRSGLNLDYSIESSVPKATLMIVYPAGDGRDATVRRRKNFLGQILEDRLRVEVREKLGAAYSPGVSVPQSEVYPDDGWIAIQTESDVDKTSDMVSACSAVAEALAEHGVTDDEIDRAREPSIAAVRDQLRRNAYWTYVLGLLHAREHVFEDIRAFPDFLKAITAENLNALAKAYLKRDRASVAIVTPLDAGGAVKDAASPTPKKPEPKSPPKKP
jgi:zinc protease